MPIIKCEHGIQKNYCRPCGGSGFCEHNKYKYLCRECGGKGICIHNIYKKYCKECGGSALCIHEKDKRLCRDCHGSMFCKHNKQKHHCKECGGSALCEHGKQKSICKECKGSSYCEHSKLRIRCKDCKGTSICHHDKRKDTCKECNPKAYCEHGKNKNICKECSGNRICIHNKYKPYCKDCGGSAYCEHGIQKYSCKLCKGTGICKHSKIKRMCKECGGAGLCKSSWCETVPGNNKKYLGYCLHCFIHLHPDLPVTRNYKTKEKATTDAIVESFPDLTWIKDKKVEDGCSRKRPDLYVDLGSHILIVEIDENQHIEYDCSCENKRLMEISKDFAHRPIVFIRFNPDDYFDTSGNKISSCWRVGKDSIIRIQKSKQTEWDMRVNTLREQIKYWIDNTTSKTLEVVQLFFDQNVKARGGAG